MIQMTQLRTLIIDESHLEPEVSLKIYRALLAWAAPRGSRFEISLQSSVYDDPADLQRLTALGSATHSAAPASDELRIEGKPDSAFVHALTSKQAPTGAIAGDNSPVEDVAIFADGRCLYGSYDYGRTQLLTVTGPEAAEVKEILNQLGVGQDVLILAPYQPGESGPG
jgi:hypothetical protein